MSAFWATGTVLSGLLVILLTNPRGSSIPMILKGKEDK